jgi:broad specificity phosphatase PhoE
LTPAGIQQAQECGARLQTLGPPQGTWNAVICSPFLRCIQTAVEICKVTGASLIIDEGWEEVRFREMLEAETTKQQRLTRPYQALAGYIAKEGVKLRNPDGPCGSDWNRLDVETLQDARVRFAKKFCVCLDRAMLSQTSFIVVSHGESVSGCLPLFPEHRDTEVVSAPFCAMVVGRLEQPFIGRKRSATDSLERNGTTSTSDAFATSGVLDRLSVIETTCEIERTAGAAPKPRRSSLPAWVRSSKVKFRAGSKLMKALGIATSNDLDATSCVLPTVDERPVGEEEMFDENGELQMNGCQQTVFVDSMIECDLVELPPIAPKPEVASSSQMNCVFGASTLLLGDYVIRGSSANLEGDSLKFLQLESSPMLEVDSDSAVISASSSETASEALRKRGVAKRGVKGPTQLREPYSPKGGARSWDCRSQETIVALNSPRGAELRPTAKESLDLVSPEVEASIPEPGYRSQASIPELDEAAETSLARLGFESASPRTEDTQMRTNTFASPRTQDTQISANTFLFSQDAVSPKLVTSPSNSSSTNGIGFGPFSERTKKPYSKWKLSLSKSGKAASVVPVFDDEVLPESLTSSMQHSITSSMHSESSSNSPGSHGSAPQQSLMKLHKVGASSLFQRRRQSMQAGG